LTPWEWLLFGPVGATAIKAIDPLFTGMLLRRDPARHRFYLLGKWARAALRREPDDRTGALARDYLELAAEFRKDWNYGNAIHDAHQLLGLVCLKDGDLKGAKDHLLAAGASPGSPQLNSGAIQEVGR
jgi:hypothetical protein